MSATVSITLRTILFDYIETFYNNRRHQTGLDHRTPAEVYAAMSRGREANTLYLTTSESGDQPCTHITRSRVRDAGDAPTSRLSRSNIQTAAIDSSTGPTSVDNPFGPPPPSIDVDARTAWLVARRRLEREELER